MLGIDLSSKSRTCVSESVDIENGFLLLNVVKRTPLVNSLFSTILNRHVSSSSPPDIVLPSKIVPDSFSVHPRRIYMTLRL